MVHGIYVPAAADQPLEEREFNALADYQAAVGGWIEAVDLPDLGVTIYVNEEGLLRHLPLNPRASFLWWYHVAHARQKAMLAGDAVLVGLPKRNGDSTDLPSPVRELLLTSNRFRIEVRSVGDPNWYGNEATFPGYWEAIVWAMVLLERLTGAEDVRVLPVESDGIVGNT